MRYISLYEAFESSTISKIVKYLTNKISKNDSKKFVNSLKKLKSIYDFPIDKISEDVVEYISTKKALKIDNRKEIFNTWGVFCVKFWFSLDKGYIGYTGVGDKRMEFNKYKNNRGNRNRDTEHFTIDDIDYIKNTLNVKTGKLKRLKYDDYRNIRHGDQVIGFFNESRSRRTLDKAKIFLDGDLMYAIQGVSSGTDPQYDHISIDETNWRDWGRYSWSIGDRYSPNSDHRCLYKYTPDNNPLSIEGFDINNSDDPSPFDFNLPMTSRGELVNWGDDNHSLGGSYDWEPIENSDFCIVFYLDNMLDPDKASFYEKPSQISKQRSEDKEGATKLMTDADIKKQNIDRYLRKLINKMGISKDTMDLRNLQKFISTILCGDYSAFSLYGDRPRVIGIFRFGENINNIMKTGSDDKEYYFNKLVDFYQSNTKEYNDIKNNMISNLSIVRSYIGSDHEDILEYFELMFSIGTYIKDYISKQNINTIEDINFTYHKIASIHNVFHDNLLTPSSSNLRNLLSEFSYRLVKRDVESYLSRRSSLDLKNDIIKLKKIEKYVKSILN